MKTGLRRSGARQKHQGSSWARRLRDTSARVLPLVLLTGLMGSSSAIADEQPSASDRERTVGLWSVGGPGVKAAAEAALVGSDADVRQFLTIHRSLRIQDDRVDAFTIHSVGGPAVRDAARKALAAHDPEVVGTFLLRGWQGPMAQDQRVEALSVMSTSGVGVYEAGKKALEGTAEDVGFFLEEGQHHARVTDNRVAVLKILSTGVPTSRPGRGRLSRGRQRTCRHSSTTASTPRAIEIRNTPPSPSWPSRPRRLGPRPSGPRSWPKTARGKPQNLLDSPRKRRSRQPRKQKLLARMP